MYKVLLGFGFLGIALHFAGRVEGSTPLQVGGFILVANMFWVFMHQKLGRRRL